MSKLVRNGVTIPQSLVASSSGNVILFKKGSSQKEFTVNQLVNFSIENNVVKMSIDDKNDRQKRSILGTMHASLKSFVKDIDAGYQSVLNLKGVGFKAIVTGDILSLTLGYSHSLKVQIPAGIEVKVDKQVSISISSDSRKDVNDFCAKLKTLRKINRYKGSGVIPQGYVVLMKEGKTSKK